jgi:hypothetical protein
MKQRFLAVVLAALGVFFRPMQVLAQSEGSKPEVRLEGYGTTVNVKLDPSSSALTWIIMIALAAACIAVMFKNAKRTHLD